MEPKAIRNFYKWRSYADGHMNKCKECHKQAVRANAELKFELYRERKRVRSARPYYVEQRRQYQMSERGRAVHRASCNRYYRWKRLEKQVQA